MMSFGRKITQEGEYERQQSGSNIQIVSVMLQDQLKGTTASRKVFMGENTLQEGRSPAGERTPSPVLSLL